jgi:hypothetical protein
VVVAQIRWIAWLTFLPHNRTVRPTLPLARVRPSGLNATTLTKSVWPPSGVGKTAFPSVTRSCKGPESGACGKR